MAERWVERSIEDLVLRAWRPFLVNRGPCHNWDTTPTRGISAAPLMGNQVELLSLSAVGLSLSQTPGAVISLNNSLDK